MPDQTTDTTTDRPVYGEPELRPGWDDDGELLNITDCGWDLSFGCNLSFGYPDPSVEGGQLQVTVATSDAHARVGITTRTVTPAQVAEFGRMLVALGATDVAIQWWMGAPGRIPNDRDLITTRTADERHHVLQQWRRRGPGMAAWRMFSRTVTTLPDGSALTAPWVEEPDHG